MRKRRYPRVAGALLASVLSLVGCGPIGWTRVTVNRPLHAQDVAFIVPHLTTWDEVTRRLGAPDALLRTGEGLAADYFYSDSKSFSVNFGWPLGFVTPVSYLPHSFVLGGQGMGIPAFQVAFDARGVVTYTGFLPGASASQYRLWPFSSPSP
jgi:hypothetical protein